MGACHAKWPRCGLRNSQSLKELNVNSFEAKNIPADVPVIDLSADFRWDPVDIQDPEWNSYWQYGLPERAGNRARLAKAKRIANPGCYASAVNHLRLYVCDVEFSFLKMQLGILPLAEELKAANPRVKIINSPHCFGN